MAQLPLIRQNRAANAHIDGATPSYLPIYIYIYIYIQIITSGILLGLFWAMFDNLGSLWWAKLGGPWSGQF